MNILGIGPLELIFIVIIMILVLGPQQMVVTARKAGALIRKIVKSPMWSTIMDTSREIREIPTKLVREAGLDEDIKEIRSTAQSVKDLKNISVTTEPINIRNTQKTTNTTPSTENTQTISQPTENSILNKTEEIKSIQPESEISPEEVMIQENIEGKTQSKNDSEVDL